RRRADQLAFLAFDRDTGVIADLGAKAGERVEDGGLAAIRIAGEDDVVRGRNFPGRFLFGRYGTWIHDHCLALEWLFTVPKQQSPPSSLAGTRTKFILLRIACLRTHLHQNLFRLALAQREIVAADFYLNGIAERREADEFDFGADEQTHFHQARAAAGRN